MIVGELNADRNISRELGEEYQAASVTASVGIPTLGGTGETPPSCPPRRWPTRKRTLDHPSTDVRKGMG
jgi:hypothetical protein